MNKLIKSIYKVSHYYAENDKEQSVYIKTEIEPERLTKILAAIQFKFEEVVSDEIPIEETDVLRLLENYYGVENVTDQYKHLHAKFELKKVYWEVTNVIRFVDEEQYKTIIQIDLYESREKCCGPQYEEIMKCNLPEDEEFLNDILTMRERYLQTEI